MKNTLLKKTLTLARRWHIRGAGLRFGVGRFLRSFRGGTDGSGRHGHRCIGL